MIAPPHESNYRRSSLQVRQAWGASQAGLGCRSGRLGVQVRQACDKVWARLHQSVGKTLAKRGQDLGKVWARQRPSALRGWLRQGQDKAASGGFCRFKRHVAAVNFRDLANYRQSKTTTARRRKLPAAAASASARRNRLSPLTRQYLFRAQADADLFRRIVRQAPLRQPSGL